MKEWNFLRNFVRICEIHLLLYCCRSATPVATYDSRTQRRHNGTLSSAASSASKVSSDCFSTWGESRTVEIHLIITGYTMVEF
jgi:hypothetical protein